MGKLRRDRQRTEADPRGRPEGAEAEEDLQPKDPGEIPREPQDPVNPGGEPAS